ncbi:hypothetical protein EsCdI10290_03998 [Escherichia sp. 10290]|nr:hypothetical protein EsCdI10290_03998 [Escherichia sp. 10290]
MTSLCVPIAGSGVPLERIRRASVAFDTTAQIKTKEKERPYGGSEGPIKEQIIKTKLIDPESRFVAHAVRYPAQRRWRVCPV